MDARVTSKPLTEKLYPQSPDLVRVKDFNFPPQEGHTRRIGGRGFFEAMFDNYTDIVGLTPLVGDRNSQAAVLKGTASDGDVTLYRSDAGLAPGLHHVGFEVWDEDDLKSSIAGCASRWRSSGTGGRSSCAPQYCDQGSDGLRLQFFVNRNWSPSPRSPKPAERTRSTSCKGAERRRFKCAAGASWNPSCARQSRTSPASRRGFCCTRLGRLWRPYAPRVGVMQISWLWNLTGIGDAVWAIAPDLLGYGMTGEGDYKDGAPQDGIIEHVAALVEHLGLNARDNCRHFFGSNIACHLFWKLAPR